ncbi:diguanylate cyclase domain-containing protein, partial [Parafrankia sp. FMc2]|uniref:diguanylate cyclase domain-containing protein n=1 Tax=Parafrankia sp. FMc2 TaxID=3233196 RepID=UPI0034D3B0CC
QGDRLATLDIPVLVLALAYPFIDLILILIVLLVIFHRRPRGHPVLAVLGAGLAAMTVPAGISGYLIGMGGPRTRVPPDIYLGNMVGLGLIAVAVLNAVARPAVAGRRPAGERARPGTTRRQRVWARLAIWYLPLAAIVVLLIDELTTGSEDIPTISNVEIPNLIILVCLMLLRQLVTIRSNEDLLRRVQAARRDLYHRALHDPLTDLGNRQLFNDRLRKLLTVSHRDGRDVALLFCDLDDFKAVNDSFGHGAGDQVLQVVAQRLRDCVRNSDTVARIGGDEFAVILEEGPDLPESIGERVLASFEDPVKVGGREWSARVSVGLVRAGHPPETAEALLHRADAAMYRAKRSGKNCLVIEG